MGIYAAGMFPLTCSVSDTDIINEKKSLNRVSKKIMIRSDHNRDI